MFPSCPKDLLHNVSFHVSRSNERKMAFAGGSHTSPKSQRKMYAQLSLSAMLVINVIFWVFLPVTVQVRP